MAGSINKVILIGNVGREPEIRNTQDGREIASFSLATSEVWRDKSSGEKKEKVEWHKVVVFSQNLVSVIKSYVKKGSKLYVEGALQTRKWSDASGVEKYSTEVVLQSYSSTLSLLDGKSAQGSEGGFISNNEGADKSKMPYQIEQIEDDEIPF